MRQGASSSMTCDVTEHCTLINSLDSFCLKPQQRSMQVFAKESELPCSALYLC